MICRYSLLEMSSGSVSKLFHINPTSGDILCVEELDRETQDQYEFMVVARDGAITSQSSTAFVTITVLDQNDNRPRFSKNTYGTYVKDTTSTGRATINMIVTKINVHCSTPHFY